jgi:CelD/BcsL family acetyltransferase involved in cellulose biosynthesis
MTYCEQGNIIVEVQGSTADAASAYSALLLPRVTAAKAFSRVRSARETLALTVEAATTLEQLVALKADYERVLHLANNRLPFALHEWHVAWCNRLLTANKRITSQPMILAVRNLQNECVAIVPLISTQRAIGPFTIRTLDLLGADPAITEIRTSLIVPGLEAQVAWAVQREVTNMTSVDWIHWGSIGGAFGETLAVGAELTRLDPLLDYVLDLPASWDSLRAGLKRNIRESIRHSYNSLKRDGVEFEFQVAREPAAVAAALEKFFALHAMRAKLSGSVTHRNHFAGNLTKMFLREVCAELAQRDRMRIFQLVIRGEVVAVRIGFVIEDSVYLYYSGFDLRWAKYGVMTTTLVESIKYAMAERMATLNFSTGNDVSKTRWAPREVPLQQAVQIKRSARSRFAWAAFQRASRERTAHSLASRLLQLAARPWD